MVQVRDSGNPAAAAADDNLDLSELWRALRRRSKLVGLTAAVVFAITAGKTAHQRLFQPVYQGSFQLLISDPISDENKRSGGQEGQGMYAELARNTTTADIPTLIEVLRSPAMLAPVAQRFGLRASSLGGRISIENPGNRLSTARGVINVTLTGGDPQQDKLLLEALSSTYLQAALNQRQQRLADGIRFLNQQAPALEAKTAELQGELAAFRQRHNLLEPLIEGAALRTQVTTLEQEVSSLQADRARLVNVRSSIVAGTLTARSFEEAIGSGAAAGGGGSSQGLSVTGTNQILLEQLTKVEQQLGEARSKFSSGSSMVRGLTAQRNGLLPLLRRNQIEAVDAALGINANRLTTAQGQLAQMASRFQKQPGLIRQYETLQQKLQIAQDNLSGFIKTRENFQLEIAQRTVPWKVITPPAMNPNPVWPSVPRNLALGVVLGLVAGAGAGLLRDRFDHVFHNPGEVKEELGEALLGHIPHVAFFKGVREDKRFLLRELDLTVGSKDEKMTGYQRFFYQEALRNLYTSLRFLNSDRPLRSVALTSSLPAEGKSLTNVLLAKTIAEMGQRVLLVDADLRKPQMHHRLGVNNLTGLSNLLTDDELHWRQVVQPVADYPGWSVITAGQRPPDPTRLLSSSRMQQLVDGLANSGDFDLIIYDTPPVLGLADAALVAEHLDGLMLLVSLGRVDRGLPKEAIARIRSAGAQLLGVVTNAVKEEGGSASSYAYGGYGYGGYGYGGYDTRSAYAYYVDSDAESAEQQPQKQAVAKTWPERTRQLQRRLLHWIDS
ncbi:polysaccharide biosynthesis tyrosine autokinase [Cyanobium sp. WKJ7-Wakatipu]|nr:polysaccharide biosynthesis tyrosine autokinase [Cyanobium sp. WKJ7-Wakatipu]